MASDKDTSLAIVDDLIEGCGKSSSCEVIDPTVTQNTSKLPTHRKYEKKQNQINQLKERSSSKILNDSAVNNKDRTNLKSIHRRCGHERHKSQKRHCKNSRDKLKNDKINTSTENACLKSSFHVAERFKRDRIRPCCFRCKRTSEARVESEKNSCQSARISRLKVQEEQTKSKRRDKPKHKGTKKHRHHFKKRKKAREEKCNLLSPISMSPLPVEDLSFISYEDIVSRDSFVTESEEELDTLIRRTKERERSMLYGEVGYRFFLPLTIRDGPFQTSTPYHFFTYSEDNSTVYTEDMDVSVHSLSTVVLTPHIGADVYSPTTNPIGPLNSQRTSEDTLKISNCESDSDVIRHPKLEPFCSYASAGHVGLCYSQMETSQEDVKEEIYKDKTVKIKKEGDFTNVKKELRSPSPLNSKNLGGKLDIKHEKDSNYNDVNVLC